MGRDEIRRRPQERGRTPKDIRPTFAEFSAPLEDIGCQMLRFVNFFRRAFPDEQFWGWIKSHKPDITAYKMCSKILNAIVKYKRLEKSGKATESMANTVSMANVVANA